MLTKHVRDIHSGGRQEQPGDKEREGGRDKKRHGLSVMIRRH
jgi:hypothetical protein